MSADRFVVLSREGCELCEEMLLALAAFCDVRPEEIRTIDIDADASLRARYGLRIPVLLLDGEPICHGHFDADEVRRLMRPR